MKNKFMIFSIGCLLAGCGSDTYDFKKGDHVIDIASGDKGIVERNQRSEYVWVYIGMGEEVVVLAKYLKKIDDPIPTIDKASNKELLEQVEERVNR